MNDAATLAADVARILGVKVTPTNVADLLLLRAATELSHHGGTLAGDRVLLELLQHTDPAASLELVSRFRDRFPPTAGDWLTVLKSGDEHHAPPVFIVSLMRLVPEDRAVARQSWTYIDSAARALAVEPEVVSRLAGWLSGAAAPDVVDGVEQLLSASVVRHGPSAWLVDRAKAQALQARSVAGRRVDIASLRARLLRTLDELRPHLESVGADLTATKRLAGYLRADHFRLAVIGEFKRGKSTLINALLGIPDLMPTDLLPCTSALIEIRGGEVARYEVSKSAALAEFEPSDEATFRRSSSRASELRSTREKAEAVAEEVSSWRVTTPSSFLQESLVAVIDSPGLGEDYARDFIARTEAERADAAVVVFDFTQLASIAELETIEHMRAKAGDLLVVVNKADLGKEADWDRARRHVLERVSSKLATLPPDRVIFVSASCAEEAIRDQRLQDPWLRRVVDLRARINAHLLERAGHIKLKVMREKVSTFVGATERSVDGILGVRKRQLDDIANLESASRSSALRYDSAVRSVEAARTVLIDSRQTAAELASAFKAALPSLLEEVEATRAEWKSEKNPVTSPKQHVIEVAEHAKKALLRAVERWVKEKGSPIITKGLDRQNELAQGQMLDVREYLRQATGVDPTEQLNAAQGEGLSAAFTDGVSGEGAALRVMAGGALSVVIGYIIADVILFYVLGLVSGFFNPILLAAALGVGLAGYLVVGQDGVKVWIRKAVFDSIENKLLRDEPTRDQITAGLGQACAAVFNRLGAGFQEKVSQLLTEVRYQQTVAEKRLEEELARLGTSGEWLKQEFARLSEEADSCREQLGAMRVLLEETGD